MRSRLTLFIVIALVLGIASGYVANVYFPEGSARFADIAALLPMAFLRLIRMIIAPLVFATLVVGIGKMSDLAMLGRVGGKALGWFIFASLISLTLGLVLVQWFSPGSVMQLPLPQENAASNVEASALSLQGFIAHTIPTSIIDAMARNEILQIVVFSLFFGTATAALGERARIVLDVLDAVAHIMLKVTGYVMLAAPLAVFGALAGTIAKEGIDIVWVYGLFIGEFYLALLILWVVLIALGVFIVGPSLLRLIRRIREPVLLAFSTASSEAAYPKTRARALRREQPGRELRAAARLLLQSRRLDDVLHLRRHVHCADVRHRAVDRAADRHGRHPDVDVQGHRRRAARFARRDRCDAAAVRDSGGRSAAPARHRSISGHGPFRDERRRQQHRDDRRREMGARARDVTNSRRVRNS